MGGDPRTAASAAQSPPPLTSAILACETSSAGGSVSSLPRHAHDSAAGSAVVAGVDRVRLAARSPQALQRVILQRHLHVSVVPHSRHRGLRSCSSASDGGAEPCDVSESDGKASQSTSVGGLAVAHGSDA